jgi:hypothetical protein
MVMPQPYPARTATWAQCDDVCVDTSGVPTGDPGTGGYMRDVLQVSGTYDPNGDVDLTGFADSMTTYAASVAALLLLGRTTGYELPESYRSATSLSVGSPHTS